MSAGTPSAPLASSIAVALALGVLMLLAPGVVAHQSMAEFVAEGGPLENISVILWLLAAGCLLWPGHRPRLPALTFAFFCFTLAVREYGMPPELVPHGRRLVQLSFYLQGPESVAYRVVTGMVMLAVMAAAVHVVIFVGREFIRCRGRVPKDTAMFILGMGVLVAAQLAESIYSRPALAASLFPEGWDALLSLESLEEGWETLGAFYVVIAAHFSRRVGRARAT